MIGQFHDPSWVKVYGSIGVGAVSTIALLVLRSRIRRNAQGPDLYDPRKYIEVLVESRFVEEELRAPTAQAPLRPKRDWQQPILRALFGVFAVMALVGYGFGLLSYKAVTNFEEANRYVQRRDFDDAIVDFRKSLQAEPNSPMVRFQLGVALVAAGKLNAAIPELRRASQLDPDNVGVLIEYGNALLNAGRSAEAVRAYRRAVSLAPNDVIAHINLASALVHEHRLDEAIREYQHAIDRNPSIAMTHLNLGEALQEAGRLEEAAAELQQAADMMPNSIIALNCLGNVLRAQGRLDEAIQQYRKIIKIKPDWAYGYFNLGSALTARLENKTLGAPKTPEKRAEAIGAFQSYLHLAEVRPEYASGVDKAQAYLRKLQAQ